MKKKLSYLAPACITVFIFVVLSMKNGFVPFGDRTLATMDADICYLDYFAYLKDVLCGKNSIAYSFGKTLGGTNIAVFSYYLSSPFNLLVAFFRKENLQLFFHILIVLKLSAAASTFYIFITQRYGNKGRGGIAVLLSVSYALCQYNIAQCSNMMWLDGVYMLPMVLLGVYRAVRGEGSRMLIFSTAAAMLFNWYTGAIDCLFSAIYFCLEAAIYLFIECGSQDLKWKVKEQGKALLRYAASMALGVMLSAVLFIPTLVSLQRGRGVIDWQELSWGITGEIPSIVQAYILGGRSSLGSVSLFCGSMALIACIGCFFAKSISNKEKIAAGCILVSIVALFYWYPCYFLFSLLKDVGSYWYRYSYIGIFSVLYLAAFFYEKCDRQEMAGALAKAAGLFSAALLVLLYVKPVQDVKKTYLTVFFLALAMFFVACCGACKLQKRKRFFQALVSIVVCLEMAGNASLLMDYYHVEDAKEFKKYVVDAQGQVADILKMDNGTYRIFQTSTRNEKADSLTANYNEPLAYGYMSISSYVSDPDYMQKDFLARVGYPINSNNMSITNDPILAADSLMGIKYILSPYEIQGLQPLEKLPEYNGKSVYQNPFCLPFAFRYNRVNEERDATGQMDPFEYQNFLFGSLVGKGKVELYEPVLYTKEQISDSKVMYHLEIPDGNYAVYGSLPWSQYMEAVLDVNGCYETGYAKWMSPTVFYIPVKGQNITADVSLSSENGFYVESEQFYALNVDKLKEITEQIKKRGADGIQVENGKADFVVQQAAEGEDLFTSIPYDDGWRITVNGKYVEPGLFADCFMSIPLSCGENVIAMRYHVPALRFGMLISVAGLALTCFVCYRERHMRR